MGPGMFDDMWKGLVALAVLLVLAGAACGACGTRILQRYEVRIERVPRG